MLKLSKKHPSKRAFITGAGSGLGKALALLLASDGWTVGITDLKSESIELVATEIEKRGGKAQLFVFDVSNRDDFKTASQDFLNKNNGVDLVINNAGVGDGGPFTSYDLDRWDWMIGINQMGVIYGCHNFLPDMHKAKSGHLINIASAAGFAYIPRVSSYNVTKSAVNALSECLHYESKHLNVDVSVVMPTFFKTNIASGWKGSEKSKKGAQKLVDNSNLEAEDVALEILQRAGNGEFRIVLPKSARWLYRFIRFFPRQYRKMVFRGEEKRRKKKQNA
jgi:short-subunit dehydrogenase